MSLMFGLLSRDDEIVLRSRNILLVSFTNWRSTEEVGSCLWQFYVNNVHQIPIIKLEWRLMMMAIINYMQKKIQFNGILLRSCSFSAFTRHRVWVILNSKFHPPLLLLGHISLICMWWDWWCFLDSPTSSAVFSSKI